MKNIEITARHKQIIEWCEQGLKVESIARALNISVHTVRAHKRTAFNRLNVHSNSEAWEKIKELEEGAKNV